ncbi:MAG: serine acetyltransferase [Ruminococcaceae bacterium]|nr:serine acetyltransferase [Oscillospiraceae bacterium]
MITTKKELKEFLLQDAKANKRSSVRSKFFGDELWNFQKLMRKCDYFSFKRKSNILYNLPFIFVKFRYHRLSVKLGFSMPYNVFDKGLSVAHRGTIVVNGKSQIGKNCRIHACVNIGVSGKSEAPRIGNNVFIGPGVKIVGGVAIADGVCLGAGAVVVKSITEPNTTWGGVPAKKISDNSSHKLLSDRLFEN